MDELFDRRAVGVDREVGDSASQVWRVVGNPDLQAFAPVVREHVPGRPGPFDPVDFPSELDEGLDDEGRGLAGVLFVPGHQCKLPRERWSRHAGA